MRLCVITALLCIGVAAPVMAQRLRSTVPLNVTPGAVALTSNAASSSSSRSANWVVIGAVAGGVGGALYSYIRTHRPEVTDHSEDGYVYIIAVPVGVFTGFWLGALVEKLAERADVSRTR